MQIVDLVLATPIILELNLRCMGTISLHIELDLELLFRANLLSEVGVGSLAIHVLLRLASQRLLGSGRDACDVVERHLRNDRVEFRVVRIWLASDRFWFNSNLEAILGFFIVRRCVNDDKIRILINLTCFVDQISLRAYFEGLHLLPDRNLMGKRTF